MKVVTEELLKGLKKEEMGAVFFLQVNDFSLAQTRKTMVLFAEVELKIEIEAELPAPQTH